MMGLTPRQGDALRFITGFLQSNGHSPSFDEMRDGLGLASYSSVSRLLGCLEERGHIRRLNGRARAIEVLTDLPVPRAPDGAPLYFVPVAGARS